jgi:hypothetical protein
MPASSRTCGAAATTQRPSATAPSSIWGG